MVNRAVSEPTLPLPERQRRGQDVHRPGFRAHGRHRQVTARKAPLQVSELPVGTALCHSTFTFLIEAIKPGTENEGLCSQSSASNRQVVDSLAVDSSERPTNPNLLQLPTPPSAPSQRFTVALKCPEALQHLSQQQEVALLLTICVTWGKFRNYVSL